MLRHHLEKIRKDFEKLERELWELLEDDTGSDGGLLGNDPDDTLILLALIAMIEQIKWQAKLTREFLKCGLTFELIEGYRVPELIEDILREKPRVKDYHLIEEIGRLTCTFRERLKQLSLMMEHNGEAGKEEWIECNKVREKMEKEADFLIEKVAQIFSGLEFSGRD